jgi:eukaryotic-like serine/threonine-protein kinase
MGMIYQAHDPVIDRKVAIKLIRADLLSGEERADYLERFRREAQAAGRCAHANIVAIYDFAVHEGNPFLAMEYVEGSNLSQVLGRSGRFSPRAAGLVIGQVLDALACAHGLGVVHRDVKPANILLLSDERIKMTDFGIARLDTSALTQAGSMLGTPTYMSPEQCRGDPVDARSDLFSTGVVLYELLSGARPFSGRNMAEIAFQVISQAPPDLRDVRPELPDSVVAVVERALAKEPDRRFGSAAEMADALRALPQVVQPGKAEPTVVPRTQSRFDQAALSTVERKLAQHVGPIARHFVQTAARQAHSLEELHELVARRIDRPELRTRFRNEIGGSLSSGRAAAPIAPAIAEQGERELTAYLGPIARVLVRCALATAASPDEFWQHLASHIERDVDRQVFLSKRRE